VKLPSVKRPTSGKNPGSQAAAPKGTADPSRAPQVPRTVLNFIEEEQRSAGEVKRQYQVVGAFSLAALALVSGIGVLFTFQTRSADGELRAQNERRSAAQAEIAAAVSQASGGEINTSIDLSEHLTSRAAELSAALTLDVDVTTMLQGLLSDLPGGVVVTGVTLIGPVTAETTAAPPTPTATVPAANTSTTPTPPREVRITATTPSFTAALEFQRRLNESGFFVGNTVQTPKVDPVAGRFEVEAVGSLNMSVFQTRRTKVLDQLGQNLSQPPAQREGN
jgi:hypothetical protein